MEGTRESKAGVVRCCGCSGGGGVMEECRARMLGRTRRKLRST
jgi:hypothetical protein